MTDSSMRLCQIAASVQDGARSSQFYESLLGLRPAGGSNWFRGVMAARVQGIPGASSSCRWLIDDKPFFQLELFEFEQPRPRPKAPTWRTCDIGYARIAIAISDFDVRIERLSAAGHGVVAAPKRVGGTRRACVIDPDGIVVELIEVVQAAPTRVVGVSLSVADLASSKHWFGNVLGLSELRTPVPERDEIWGLPGARRDAIAFDAGGCWIEVAQYRDPTPAPRRTDHCLSDIGLLNIAFGFRSRAAFRELYERVRRTGYRSNVRAEVGVLSSLYVNDDQGFSFELLYCAGVADPWFGFTPPTPLISRLMRSP